MKNRLFTLAAALTLAAVIGGIYAVPALAQVIKAALIKNVDEHGRVPYSATVVCNNVNIDAICSGTGAVVPAGKRLIVEYFGAEILSSNPANSIAIQLLTPSPKAFFHAEDNGNVLGSYKYSVSEPVVVYVEAGAAPGIALRAGGVRVDVTAVFTGYLVDLSI